MSTARLNILFVEDNEIDRLSLERLEKLESYPYQYVIASSTEEARQCVSSTHFDVAVLDYIIGNHTAFDLFDVVHPTPIIIITGIGDEEIAVKAMKAGAYDYLRKDTQGQYLHILHATIENVIKRKQAEDEVERYRAYLEELVQTRTTELQQEIEKRKQAEQALMAEHELLAHKVEARTAELRTANEALARAARLKDEFLANISHELRTPLHIMLGLSEALQEQVYGTLNDKQHTTIHTIEEKGQHLLELITDLLDLSRIITGDLELQFAPVVVEAVAKSSIEHIRQIAEKKHLHISFTCSHAIRPLHADERRVKQILINLLKNAIKFTPEGGSIGMDITGDQKEPDVRFMVWDTGIGIAHEDLRYLFAQPLVQLDGKLSRRYPGIGLGLSLSYHIVNQHGGHIHVESDVGKGSRFVVTLPLEAPFTEQ